MPLLTIIRLYFHSMKSRSLPPQTIISFGTRVLKKNHLHSIKPIKPAFSLSSRLVPFAFARLEDRLSDSQLWQNATRSEGVDPMGLLPTQPHVEFWNAECYSPKYMLKDFPENG